VRHSATVHAWELAALAIAGAAVYWTITRPGPSAPFGGFLDWVGGPGSPIV